MQLINGLLISEKILKQIKQKIKFNGIKPRLDIFYIGNNFASERYVNKKKAAGKKVGIDVEVHDYNSDQVDGIMIQLPLPKHFDTVKILNTINPNKDVDGLTPDSLGALWQGLDYGFPSATPLAIIECIKYASIFSDNKYTVDELDETEVEENLFKYLKGKKILIINTSNIVGKPLSALLLRYFPTLTIAHKHAKNLKELCLNSEIIITGTGIEGLNTQDMIQDDSILIDVGINESALGISGDISYRGAEEKIKWLTPVPGGVGPITVAKLLSNVVKAHENRVLN